MTEVFNLIAQEPKRAPRVRRGGWSWGPVETAKLRVLSMGAGVQSTTLALMAAHGEIGPMPDCAIFADTGAEPAAVYEQVEWLQSGNVLPFPIHIVSAGSLKKEIEEASAGLNGMSARPPFFVKSNKGRLGQVNRQCTQDYKIDPIRRKQRELLGYQPRRRIPDAQVEVWIGISTDEVVRAGASWENWSANRYPLLEQRMSRRDCEAWLVKHGYPVPAKSACTFCPYRSDVEWRLLRDNDPAAFADAVAIDDLIRGMHKHGKIRGELFIHRTGKPLSEVDLSTAEERGQGDLLMVCEAGCGL
ncbi:hypothetical protein U8C41_25715 [Sinorhizobium meliloti]|uniref:hypothetical protein n=1 Tax=Rhizobium meliloti TaxID=382 RepID=UPI000D1F361E|nr:hypothetical protein [Sinorhizobium meliloti]RMI10456.1 hypothetical protein DA101_003630 [Sinorhizobium meliloti]WQO99781.1 hypothetical protein U8C41_25715 [Sinorhizobium meliloti]